MADQSIRKDFVDGVNTIFTTLFNNGTEQDGVLFYPFDKNSSNDVYGEQKYKKYGQPKLLVCKATIAPTHGELDIETVKDKAEFVITFKSLQDNGIEVSHEALEDLRKGIVKFHGMYYEVDNIVPRTYIEDVFLFYTFYCSENPSLKPIFAGGTE